MTADDFDLDGFLPYRLAVLAERVSRRLAVEYGKTHGLTVAEWRVLAHLSRSKEVSIREIHDCVSLEKPRVSRAVSKLDELGLVRKEASATDSRLVAISLTEAGHAVLGEIAPAARDIEAGLLAALSPDEAAAFARAMEKLHAVLDGDPQARARGRGESTGCG